MTVRIYRSTDASAPSLTGQVGSLTTLLDAILVNGYGSQTAAGWTISQTTTNKRGYLQNLTGANNPSGVLLYVDDTGPGAGGAKEARACGFETMSAITPVGTQQFPTSGQLAIGVGTVVIRKSTTADSTARVWTCIANGQTIYLFVETGDFTTPNFGALPFVFGDFFSYKSSDTYAVCIIGRTAENSGSQNCDWLISIGYFNNVIGTLAVTNAGHFIDRSWTGVGGSVLCGKRIDLDKMGYGAGVGAIGGQGAGPTTANGPLYGIGFNSNSTYFPYPNGPDGACWESPIWLNHNGAVRGYLKGLWAPLHDKPLNHADTFTVSGGNLNAKSFIAQNCPTQGVAGLVGIGQLHIETSDTWT